MKVRGTNTQVDPVYWAHLRRWPYKQAVEYEVSEKEYADILADERIEVEAVAAPEVIASAPEPDEHRGGRQRKVK